MSVLRYNIFLRFSTKTYVVSTQKDRLKETILSSNQKICYITPIKDLLWLAVTSFHWFWQILMSTSDELNLVQDRLTSGFGSATRQLKIDPSKFSPGHVDIILKAKIDIGKLT